jgi:hypothetical protein
MKSRNRPPAECQEESSQEIQQLYTYVCRVSTRLSQALDDRNTEEINSFLRALHSGVVRIKEAATKKAHARGWNLNVVEGMMQDLDGSTCSLLQDVDRVLQELAEEAKASWKNRARYQAARVMHLAGEAFQALDERRWFRKDCLEY